MKIMKKIAALMLAAFLVIPSFSIVVNAADGRVSFTDPKTKTGETVEVTCALRAGTGSLESFDITLKYDPAFLAFESGEEGTSKETDGVIKFSGTGNGTNRIGFTMKFQALQVGTTKIEVTESTGVVSGGEAVTCVNGNSTIEIEQGTEPVTAPTGNEEEGNEIVIGDKSYHLSDSFDKSVIPVGFEEDTITYDGGEHKIVKSETGNVKLGYLVDSEGKGDFFLYNEENATFSPYVQVTVSPTTSITLLKAEEGLKVPAGHQEVKLTVNEYEFPAWQDENNEGFYLVYAMNANGEKGFYQYDTQEESYQRFVANEAAVSEEKEAKVGKVAAMIDEHFSTFVLCGSLLVLVLVIIIIVLAIKLRHRNLELDDLYEEFDIDDDEEEDEVIRIGEDKKEKRSQFKRQPKEEFFDEEDSFEEDGFENDFDDFESDFENDFSNDFTQNLVNENDFEDDYEEDFKKVKKYMDEEESFDFGDDFEVDFIDLD